MLLSPDIGAAVLAAGSGRRFGADKRLYPLDGKPLLHHALGKPLSRGLPTLLVLKPTDELIIDQLAGPWLGNDRLTIVYAENALQGMGHSLAAAAAAAHANVFSAMLVMLADMPYIAPRTLDRVCQAYQPKGIVVPHFQGLSGHPVLFASYWFEQLAALTGDQGARLLIEDHPGYVTVLDIDDPGIVRDIDRRPVGGL